MTEQQFQVPWWKRWIWWLPPLIWAALIWWWSSIPGLGVGGPWDFVLRKLAHVTEFAVLAGLIYLACKSGRKHLLETQKVRALVFVAVIAVLYALSDEVHQGFVPTRHPSIVDWLIDCVGIAIMAWLIKKAV